MKALVSGKRIALVGRAGSIVGTGHGPAIDGADVVIRVNWLLPTPEEHVPDMGARTDLVYTCLRCATARKLAAEHGVRAKRISGGYRLKVSRQFFPKREAFRVSTGLLAAVQCVRYGAARVNLYGFDLLRSEHVQERAPDGNNPRGSADGRWSHSWKVERRAWRLFVGNNRGVVVPDLIFRDVLR